MCTSRKNPYPDPVEGHWKFLSAGWGGGGGVLSLKQCMKINQLWNFLGGSGVQNKNLPRGEQGYGYFLELHNDTLASRSLEKLVFLACRNS